MGGDEEEEEVGVSCVLVTWAKHMDARAAPGQPSPLLVSACIVLPVCVGRCCVLCVLVW